jgi:hypothetical protein
MRRFLCTTCGTQFPESEAPPLACPICEDERALLVLAPGGNLLWDCTSPFHDEIAARVEEIGGIAAISISHPHYYSSMVEWAEAFDSTAPGGIASSRRMRRPSSRSAERYLKAIGG